jgi:chromosome partitioning protein
MTATRKITICSQKGGVGKTALAVNLASNFAFMSKPTLLVDLSPAADATCHLGVKNENLTNSSYHLLTDKEEDISKTIVPTRIRNLSLIPSDRSAMSGVEIEIANMMGREAILSEKIRLMGNKYEFIIFDCPPGTGLLTINSLMASTEWLLPVQVHYLALNGLDQLFMTTLSLERRLKHQIRLSGILCTLYDGRTRLSHEIESELRRLFGSLVLNNTIQYRTSIGESPTFGMTIGEYEPGKEADKNFKDLALELIGKGMPSGSEELLKSNGGNGENGNGEFPEKKEIRKTGKHLRNELQAVMKDSDLIAKKPMYGLLSELKDIEEYRKRKRAPLTGEEADELWK